MKIYTDGAIHKGTLGWGFVAVNLGVIEHAAYGKIDKRKPKDLLAQRNVAAEMKAVMEAIEWAKRAELTKVVIIHDYMGCAAWPLGTWQAKNRWTKAYADYVRKQKESIAITFEWVKGHSGDKWNDEADALAKKGARL